MNKIIFTFTIFLILIGFGNYSFAVTEEPVVVIETSLGNIVIELFPAYATEHVKNFLALASNGYYDSTLFHRIIPGFMIQGGDPNTKSGEPNTWGQGGPDTKLDAEFNPIKHNRGIVSMARSADPNSAGSQFFIVHQDSNFLDGEYTAFGRLASQESFETLDKIAAVTTGASDRPVDPEQVRIIKATIIATADVSGYIPYVEPERTGTITPPTESIANQVFESKELDITFSAPVGWLLQQPDSSISGAPDVAAVGPKVDGVNPVISLTIKDQVDKTIDELITEKNNVLAEAVYLNKLEILAQEKIKTNIYQTEAIGNFEVDDKTLQIKFLEVMILSEQKSYTFAYSNTVDNFNNDLPKFQESLDSFRILSQESPIMTTSEDKSSEAIFQDPLNDPQNLNEQILIGIGLIGAFVAPILIEIRYMNKWSKEYNIKSTTKKSVNIKWQIVLLFVPIVRLWAYSRINKLGFGFLLQFALVGIMFGTVIAISSILSMINP